jgi:hypothetical protein
MPSTTRPTRDLGPRTRTAPEEVTIEDWRFRARPVASLLAIALAAGLAWLAGWAAVNWAIGALVAVVLAVTLWRTWLPVRYELSGSGILQSVLGWRRRIPWAAVQQVELRSDGVLFSPDPIVAPLTPLRGLYLHWGEQREAVVAQLEYYVPSAAAARDVAPRQTPSSDSKSL